MADTNGNGTATIMAPDEGKTSILLPSQAVAPTLPPRKVPISATDLEAARHRKLPYNRELLADPSH